MKLPHPKPTRHDRYNFEVRVPKALNGRVVRKYFNTQSEAQKFADDLCKQLGVHGPLTASREERLLLARYRTELTLAEMEAAMQSALAAKGKRQTPFKDLANAYLAHQLKAMKEGRIGKRHHDDLASRIPPLVKAFGEQPVNNITSDTIQTWLDSLTLAPRSKKNYLNVLASLFNHGMKKSLVVGNPTKNVTTPKVKTDVTIYTAEQIKKLLKVADAETYKLVVFGAFAGLRTSEIERLRWDDIKPDLTELYVRPGKTANAERWVKLTLPLQKILRQTSGSAFANLRSSKSLMLPNGVNYNAKLKSFRKAGVTPEDNALRHSYGSHHLVAFAKPQHTALQMGHHSPQVTFNAYRRAVSEAEAKAYWAI